MSVTALETTQTTTPSPLPPGVERHGRSLRINFMYRGKRCREVVERGQFDELSIAMAARLRQQVVDAIAAGRFDYSKRFPGSTTGKRLLAMEVGQEQAVSAEHAPKNIHHMTVAEGVEAWLKTQSSGKSKSTAINYRSRARHVLQRFGDRRLADVTTQELQQFRNQLVRSSANPAGLSPRSANDVLTVVREFGRMPGRTTSPSPTGLMALPTIAWRPKALLILSISTRCRSSFGPTRKTWHQPGWWSVTVGSGCRARS